MDDRTYKQDKEKAEWAKVNLDGFSYRRGVVDAICLFLLVTSVFFLFKMLLLGIFLTSL